MDAKHTTGFVAPAPGCTCPNRDTMVGDCPVHGDAPRLAGTGATPPAAVAFEPHHDDVTLFAAYEAMRHRAHVVTVLTSQLQQQRGLGISQQQRAVENNCAVGELGLTWTQWPYPDDGPDWDAVTVAMRALDDRLAPEVVLAPAVEPGGHEHHNQVGELALAVFGPARTIRYLTYRRGYGRSVGVPVHATADMVCRKLRALACYRSQIGEPSTRSWFMGGCEEWLA